MHAVKVVGSLSSDRTWCCIYPHKYVLSEILCYSMESTLHMNTEDSLVDESSMQSKRTRLPSSACSLGGGSMLCNLSGRQVLSV